MSASLTVDKREFSAAIKQLARIKDDTLKNIINQAALDVAGYCFDTTPPYGSSGIEGHRARVKAYLRTILAQKFKWNKKGTKTRKAGKANDQLQRVHLIVQALRKRAGKPGLHGAAMRAAAASFVQKSQTSVGYLKSVFIPLIRRLNRTAKYKFPFARTKNISRWRGGSGYGLAEPARSGWNAVATLTTKIKIDASQAGKIGALQNNVMREALTWKTRKLKHEAERILSAEFFKVMPRRGIQIRKPSAPPLSCSRCSRIIFSMTQNDILDQIDDAFVSYLNKSDIGDIPTENVFPGHWKEGDDTKTPNIVVEAVDATENGAVNSGNWTAEVSITVTTQADDSTRDAHKARVNAVFALIMADDAEALVSAALDTFTLFAVRDPRQSKRRNGRKWENTLTIEIECCGGDIS